MKEPKSAEEFIEKVVNRGKPFKHWTVIDQIRNKCAKITCHNQRIRRGEGFCRTHFLELTN